MTSHLQRYEQAFGRAPHRVLPADQVVVELIVAARKDLDSVGLLFPLVRKHRLRGKERPEGARERQGVDCTCGERRLAGVDAWLAHYTESPPETAAEHCLVLHGEDLADIPADGSDPTGEAVCGARFPETEAADRRALVAVVRALGDLDKARRDLANRLPILSARMAPDYKADVIPIGSRALSVSDCQLCKKPASRIRAGWCSGCYQAWMRWAARCAANGDQPDKDAFVRWRKAELERAEHPEQPATVEAGA